MSTPSTGAAPRVTVGMPVYNGLPHVKEAFRAVLAQTFQDFEIVVADNASTDGTVAELREIAAGDARVRFLTAERNGGLPWNFNRPLAHARGELFTWASSDDVMGPEHLARCVGALDARPDAVLAFGRVALIDEAGERVGAKDDEELAVLDVPPSRRMREFLDRHIDQVIGYGGLIRVPVLRALGGLPVIYGGDLELAARLAMRAPWVQVPEVTYAERRHDDQAHNVQWGDLRDQMRVMNPAWDGRFAFPQWRLTAGLVGAALAARVPVRQRALAVVAVASWAWRNLRWLYFDLKRNLVTLVRGSFTGPFDTRAARATREG